MRRNLINGSCKLWFDEWLFDKHCKKNKNEPITIGGQSDFAIALGIVGLEKRLDGGQRAFARVELRFAEQRVHRLLVDAIGKLLRAIQIANVIDEHLHRFGVHRLLLVDRKRLFEQLRADRNLGNFGAVVLIESLNVLHHALLVGFDRRQNQQILQVAILRKLGIGRRIEHNLFEQTRHKNQ